MEGEKGASEAKALRRTRGRAKGAEKAEVVGPREEEARTTSARQGRGKKGAEPATKPRRVQFRGQKENMRMEVDQQKQSRKRRKKAGSEGQLGREVITMDMVMLIGLGHPPTHTFMHTKP